jgi:hypothetical protein
LPDRGCMNFRKCRRSSPNLEYYPRRYLEEKNIRRISE